MSSPNDRRFLKTHEWHKTEGDLVVIGVSKFAVDELTDITYLDIRVKSGPIKAGQSFGEIESVKATSELYCGIDGQVVAVNQQAVSQPGVINEDPWEKGWLIKVKPANPAAAQSLMDAAAYDKQAH